MINRMLARMRLKTLERILETERNLLLSGDLEKIADYASQKEEVLRVVEAMDEDCASTLRPAIETIQRKAERNVGLMKAAMKGLTEAANLVADLEKGPETLKVYGDAGQAQSLAGR